jgi:hypothetical protein
VSACSALAIAPPGGSESALGTCVMPKLKRPVEALEAPLQ